MEIVDVYFEICPPPPQKRKEKTGVTQPVGHPGDRKTNSVLIPFRTSYSEENTPLPPAVPKRTVVRKFKAEVSPLVGAARRTLGRLLLHGQVQTGAAVEV